MKGDEEKKEREERRRRAGEERRRHWRDEGAQGVGHRVEGKLTSSIKRSNKSAFVL